MEHSVIVCEGPGRLSLIDVRDGVPAPARTIALQGLWPCWSPDGSTIAVSALQTGTKEVRGSIELLDSQGIEQRTAHTAMPGAPPVIAPRVPHYVQWSPDSSILSFVAPGAESLGLHLSDRAGAYSSDRVANGAPLFSAWSPDSTVLAIHAGADLSVYNVATRETRQVTSNAIGFRAPVVVGRRVLYASSSPPGVSVMSANIEDPADTIELARFEGGVALQPTGTDTSTVSVAMTREAESGNFHELSLLEPAAGARPRVIALGPFAAAIWSPAGDRVAVVSPAQTGDGRYSIQVYDREGRYVAATEQFVPSQDYRMYLGFFDQYALSHMLWSPDGAAFTCCGRLPGDGTAWSFADRQNDYAWYWPVQPGAPMQRLGPGDSAFFRPGPTGNGG